MDGASQRWRENWRAVGAPGAVRVQLRRFSLGPSIEPAVLPRGTAIVISASAPGAGRRCSTFASRAGIELERQYLAFPSAEAPGYLVEDSPAAVRFFLEHVLVAPPRSVLSFPIAAALRLCRTLIPWWVIRLLAPGRVMVGRSV